MRSASRPRRSTDGHDGSRQGQQQRQRHGAQVSSGSRLRSKGMHSWCSRYVERNGMNGREGRNNEGAGEPSRHCDDASNCACCCVRITPAWCAHSLPRHHWFVRCSIRVCSLRFRSPPPPRRSMHPPLRSRHRSPTRGARRTPADASTRTANRRREGDAGCERTAHSRRHS